MRRALAIVVVTLTALACGRTADPPVPTISRTPPPSGALATPTLPAGVPASYPGDRAAADVPPSALIPSGASVENRWIASTSSAEAIVVAYAEPAGDPFHQPRGVVVWRHFPDDPPWRPIFGAAASAADGVLAIQALTADVTGDGSEDALIREATGGSGDCASWMVVDIETGARVFDRSLCDTRIDPATDPAGLVLIQARYRQGDAHCCPSAIRRTTLSYADDGRWTVASRDVTRI